MTYADKGLALFSLMNAMSDALILESDIRGCTVIKPKRERSGHFFAFMNHPAMVAVLCAVVSLGVVVAIVMAGRGGPVTPPVANTPHVEETVTQDPSDSESEALNLEGLDYTAEIQSPSYALTDDTLDFTLISTKPGVILYWRNNFTLYRIEGEVEILVYQYEGNDTYEGSGYASSEDEYATATGCITMHSIHAYQKAQGDPPLMPGRYRLYFDEKAYDRRVFAEVMLTEAETTPEEPETRYEPTESVYACTLVAEQTAYYLDADYIKTTIVAAEPGKTWEGNGSSYRLCRLEGDREIEVYSYSVEPWRESYPKSPDDFATLSLWCNLSAVRRQLEEKGETLTAGKYRMYYMADTGLGIESPYVDVELVDRGEMGQTNEYTLIPHTPTAGINDNYFLISMTAAEPGKVLTASAAYRLYRLNGDEEELIHNYDVELAVYERPDAPNGYAVYETGVSLVWAKSNLEAKGDTLTPGWYRVKFGRATLDFELVDKTGISPAIHPFDELPMPETVYTSLSTEDMALMEQYERIYTSAYKIEKLWAFFTKLTVTEASPPENIRSGDGLGIHVIYPDGTKGRIFFWGEQHEYFYIDDGPWYQAPPEEVAALMTQIKNVPSDPT